MRVLVACEFSGIVRDAFIARGHDAVSCDLLPTERPGPHIQGDVVLILNDSWDLIIAHPPCQYLSLAGNVWLKQPGRLEKRGEAMAFFYRFVSNPCRKIAIENPPGYPYRAYRKPDQIIHPYNFGHPVRKKTCLWLKGLPPLKFTTPEATAPEPIRFDGKRNRHWVDCGNHSQKNRSRTFQGIANAMAEQWG
jgi:hypothetical protein